MKKLIDKVLIIDGSNFLHRQLHQSNMWELEYNGVKTGGVYGFFRSLLVTMNKYPNYYPVVTMDYGRSKRRLALYPNYKHSEDQKAERAERQKQVELGMITVEESVDEYRNELVRQGNIIKSILKLFKIPVLSIPGWEGDDIMAILTRVSNESVIATDDRDMYQLIAPNIDVFRPMRFTEQGEKGAVVKYSDYEDQVRHNVRHLVIEKAILGDGSDNIPSVAKGLGAKRAEKVVELILDSNENPNEYLPKIAELGKSYYTAFVENHDQYLINLQLVDLSLVETDPMIVESLQLVLSQAYDAPSMIDLVKVLSSQGINNLDYSRLIQLVMLSRENIIHE